MKTDGMSLHRVVRLSLLLFALFGVAVFTHPAMSWLLARQAPATANDPLHIPEIYGVLQFRHASPAGVDVRVGPALPGHQTCPSLPIRARTDAQGIFFVPAEHRRSKHPGDAFSIVDVCLMKGRRVLTQFGVTFDRLGSAKHRLFCRYPAPNTGHPEDQVCIPADGLSFQRLRASEWFEQEPR